DPAVITAEQHWQRETAFPYAVHAKTFGFTLAEGFVWPHCAGCGNPPGISIFAGFSVGIRGAAFGRLDQHPSTEAVRVSGISGLAANRVFRLPLRLCPAGCARCRTAARAAFGPARQGRRVR